MKGSKTRFSKQSKGSRASKSSKKHNHVQRRPQPLLSTQNYAKLGIDDKLRLRSARVQQYLDAISKNNQPITAKYDLEDEQQLGEGGFAKVVKATVKKTGLAVAVKVVPLKRLMDSKMFEETMMEQDVKRRQSEILLSNGQPKPRV